MDGTLRCVALPPHMLAKPRRHVISESDIEMLPVETLQDIDVFHGIASAALARRRPSGYGGAAFASFATIERSVACPAVAREASEGWWSQAGSNRRPLACHASALPAELWPRQP